MICCTCMNQKIAALASVTSSSISCLSLGQEGFERMGLDPGVWLLDMR